MNLFGLFRSAGVTPIVWDVTSDIGIAAFRVIISDDSANTVARPMPAAFGAGCHPDRDVALVRALTEAAQSRLTVIAGSRDDFGRTRYRTTQSAEALSYYSRLARSGGGRVQYDTTPVWIGETVAAELDFTLGQLRRSGFERVLVIDLSEPGLPVSIARVIVPGLEGPTESMHYKPGLRCRALRPRS